MSINQILAFSLTEMLSFQPVESGSYSNFVTVIFGGMVRLTRSATILMVW